MLGRFLKITIIILLSMIIMTVTGFCAVCGFYSSNFLCGTRMNGIDIGGMNVEKASEYLTGRYGEGIDYSNVTVLFKGRDGYKESVDPKDIGLKVDMTAQLTELMSSQKPYDWPVYYLDPIDYEAAPEFTFDEDKLHAVIDDFECIKEIDEDQVDLVEIQKTADGYTLFNNVADIPDEGAIYECAADSIKNARSNDVVIDFSDCYIPHEIPSEFNDTVKLYEKISKVADAKIEYSDYPLSYELDGSKCVKWLVTGKDGLPILDENGDLVFDEDRIEQCTEKLAEVFNTSGGVVEWKKQNGETVSLKNQMQGYMIDQDAEALRIKESLLRGGVMKRAPLYVQTGPGRGRDVVGKTYIEVDMGAQKLYYYVNGILKLKTDVVTGNLRRGNGTPEKLCYVYFKQKNRTLRGANYATFVYYWMAVTGHIGIHDATWRGKFGGEIYKTDGSHGCINIPKNMAAKLYDMVEVGTPCVMYY